MRKAAYTGRITHEEGLSLLYRAFTAPLILYEDDDLLIEAYHLANQFAQPRAYDAQYLALAQRLDCPFWTLDETLYRFIHRRFEKIKWLGDFSPPNP